MHEQLIKQLSIVVEDAVRDRPMTWEGNPLPAMATADPLGCLPVLAAATCSICAQLNIKPPVLRLQANVDASFGYALTGLQLGEHGIAAFILALRDVAVNCDRDLELLIPALEVYLENHTVSVSEAMPQQEIE